MSIMDLHLSSTYGNEREYALGHCRVVNWLIENFKNIQFNRVSYNDYKSYVSSHGLSYFNEECFNKFKNQRYI